MTRGGRGLTSGARGGVALGICLAVLVAACAPEEEVLPGPRFDLRELETAAAAIGEDGQAASNVPAPQPPRTVPTPVYSVEGTPAPLRLPGMQAVPEWTHSGQNPSHNAPHAQLRPGPLSRVWSAEVGSGNSTRRRIFAAPVVAGGRVFTLDAQMTVRAVAAATGAVLWQRALVPAGETPGEVLGGGLAVSDGRLYVTTGYGELRVLDAASGTPVWQQRFRAAATAPPVVEGGLVYVATRDGLGSALDRDTGRVVWELEGTAAQAAVLGSGAPTVTRTAVVFASGEGDLTASLKQAGVNLWSTSVSGRRTGRAYSGINGVAGGPVAAGDTIYVATNAGRMAAVDASTGGRLWTAREGGTGPVVVAGGSLFVVSDEARLLRLDAGDGSVIWAGRLPLYTDERVRRRKEVFVYFGPVLAGRRLILLSSDGRMRDIDPRSGTLLRVTELSAPAAAPPVVAGGTLYVLTEDGRLHAYR